MGKLTALTLTLAMILMAASPAAARCFRFQADCSGSSWSWQKPKPATSWAITNKHGQRLGDIYNSGTGHLKIRNNHRQIIGYIERDGTVTNTSRQPVADIELD